MFSVFETNYRTAAFEFCNIDVPIAVAKLHPTQNTNTIFVLNIH